MTKQEIIDYLYEFNTHADITIEEMAEDLATSPILTEVDYIELRDRYGEEVEFVVKDMVSGKEERWKNNKLVNKINPYKKFAEWVAKEIMETDEDSAFTEICCRKLFKLGLIDEKDGYWIKKENKNDM